MKRSIAVTAIVAGVLLLGAWGLSRGHGGSYKGHGYGPWEQRGLVSFFIEHQGELGLVGEQVAALESIRETFGTETASLNEELRRAYQELSERMREDQIDVAAAGENIEQIATLRAQWGKRFVEAIAGGKRVLTSEQLQKARELRSQK